MQQITALAANVDGEEVILAEFSLQAFKFMLEYQKS